MISFHWDQHRTRATSMSFQGRGLVDVKLGHILNAAPQMLRRSQPPTTANSTSRRPMDRPPERSACRMRAAAAASSEARTGLSSSASGSIHTRAPARSSR
jgi:hypothetical protein